MGQVLLVSENILFFAFRYALGRQTYAVSIVVDEIIEHWDSLEQNTKIQMHKEIREAINDHAAGWGCDVTEWRRILQLEID